MPVLECRSQDCQSSVIKITGHLRSCRSDDALVFAECDRCLQLLSSQNRTDNRARFTAAAPPAIISVSERGLLSILRNLQVFPV
jgi:hypothetical protein